MAVPIPPRDAKIETMKIVICPKCKQPVVITDGKDFAVCCDELIYVQNDEKIK